MHVIFALIDWTLYSATWIACCAVMLSLESCWVNQSAIPTVKTLLLIFSSVFCQYNLHYFARETDLTRSLRDLWIVTHRWWYLPAIVISGAVAFTCYLQLSPVEMVVVASMAAVSMVYSLPLLPGRRRLKQYGVMKPFILAAVWVVMTVWLPIHDSGSDLVHWIMARRFVFMLSLCLVFDIRDAAKDATQKVMTIPVLYGTHITYWLIAMLLVCFIVFALIVEIQLRRPGVLVALVLSAVLSAWSIWRTKGGAGERYYLLVIDGMMILQTVLVWIAVILN